MLALQRQAGNRAVGRMLRRWSRRDDYVIGAGAVGIPLFASQHIGRDPVAGISRRRQTISQAAAGGLEAHEQFFDPMAPRAGPNAPAGTWVADPAATRAVAGQPKVKLSDGGRLAVQDTGQPRVFFIEAGLLADANRSLGRAGSALRVVTTGGPSISIGGRVLAQASVSFANNVAGTVAQAIANECNEVASRVTGRYVKGPPVAFDPALATNRGAKPHVGQVYAFTGGDKEEPMREFISSDPARRKFDFTDTLLMWRDLDERLERRENDAFAGISGRARVLTMGWATHFEGVIARDGHDRLTVANYNRGPEVRHEKRRAFRELYLSDATFAAAFDAEVARLVASKKGGRVTWLEIVMMMDPTLPSVRSSLSGSEAAKADALADFDAATGATKNQLFYFELYGRGKHSFHARYEPAGRGRGGTTRVIQADDPAIG